MLYIGLPLYPKEIMRLLSGLVPEELMTFEEDYEFPSRAVCDYLKKTYGSDLQIYWLDKGVHVLGFELPVFRENIWGPNRSVDECIMLIQTKKMEWTCEMKKLGINLNGVILARMEDEDEIVNDPEPILMEWN